MKFEWLTGRSTMRRRLDTLAVAPMMGFTIAGCSDFTSVNDSRNGTELLDEGCHGEAVEAFTRVIETDPPEQPLEMAYWRRSLAPYESGRLEEAVSDDSALLNLAQDNPDFLPADAELLAEGHAIRTTAHLTSGDFDNAETALRTVIAILPKDHERSQGAVACRTKTGEIE
jgi:tetratricopeptide (TPR) repeat protein